MRGMKVFRSNSQGVTTCYDKLDLESVPLWLAMVGQSSPQDSLLNHMLIYAAKRNEMLQFTSSPTDSVPGLHQTVGI